MDRLQIVVDSPDQTGVNGFVNVVIKKCRLQCGGIPPQPGRNHMTLRRCPQSGGKRIAEFAVSTMDFTECGFPDLPIRIFQERMVIGVIERFSLHRSEGQIRVIQHRKRVVRRPGHPGIKSDDFFFRF